MERWKQQSQRCFGGIENTLRTARRKKFAQKRGRERTLPQLRGRGFVEAAEGESLRVNTIGFSKNSGGGEVCIGQCASRGHCYFEELAGLLSVSKSDADLDQRRQLDAGVELFALHKISIEQKRNGVALCGRRKRRRRLLKARLQGFLNRRQRLLRIEGLQYEARDAAGRPERARFFIQ